MKNSGLLALLCLCNIISHPIKGADSDADEHLDNLSVLSKPTQRLKITPGQILCSPKIDPQSGNNFSEESLSANTAPSTRRRQLVRQGTRRKLDLPSSNSLFFSSYDFQSSDFQSSNSSVCTSRDDTPSATTLQVRRYVRPRFNVKRFIEHEYSKMSGVFSTKEPRLLTIREVESIKKLGDFLKSLSSQNTYQGYVVENVHTLAQGFRVSMLEYETNTGSVILIHLRNISIFERPYSLLIYPSKNEMGQSFEPVSRQEIPLTIDGMKISLDHVKGGLNEFWRTISLNQYLALRGVLTYYHQRGLPFSMLSQIKWADCSPALRDAIRGIYFRFKNDVETLDNLTLPLFMNLYHDPIQLTLNNKQPG